jgi:preprotein translocase subunit SecA
VEKSELLASMLKRRGIRHEVLNAKFHEKEAPIVAQAGRSGSVTIATNMAGRGTDIKLGGDPAGLASQKLHNQGLNPAEVEPEVYEAALEKARAECDEDHQRVVAAGGLHIIGTERHDARRIDNQLRGRAGRQGDPGSSRFYLSLEDALLKRFASDRVTALMERMGLEGDVAIESRMVSKTVENAQSRVEGHNFDIRKRVVEYDDVINKQREKIYAERDKVLHNEDLSETVMAFVEQELELAVDVHLGEVTADWDLEGLVEAVRGLGLQVEGLDADALAELGTKSAIGDHLVELAAAALEQRETAFGDETWSLVERAVLLRAIDTLWVEHLTELEDFRRGVGLRGYGGTDPLVEFKREAYKLYDELRGFIRHQVAATIFRVTIQRRTAAPQEPTAMPTLTPEQLAKLRSGQGAEARGSAAAAIASGGSATSSSGALATAEFTPLPATGSSATGSSTASAPGDGVSSAAGVVPSIAPVQQRPMRLQHGDETVGMSAGSHGPAGPADVSHLGRNDPCWCGSGKKFKRCHGA